MIPIPDTDKRRFIRYELLDCARVTVSPQDVYQSIVVDIGLGGLQMRARNRTASGAHVAITVGRDDADPLELQAEVRHCVPMGDTDLHSIGVRFTPRNHDERLAIAEYVHSVFQRQCELLSN